HTSFSRDWSSDVCSSDLHIAHRDVSDEVVDRVHERVLAGMGLLVLHSGHFSKIFKKLMGTTCSLEWRESHDTELVWTVSPEHPRTEERRVGTAYRSRRAL